jgi:hypothetical protein
MKTKRGHPNITGKRFGKLVALRYAPESDGRESIYFCRCDCGNEVAELITNLLGGWATSCDECLSKT